MSDRSSPSRWRRRLKASCSLVAMLIATGAPPAWAACTINDVGVSISSATNATAINCINIQNSTVSGNVTNAAAGTITATGTSKPTRTGITINKSTITGTIANTGAINITKNSGAGILIDNHAVVSGGLSNSGSISATHHLGVGIYINTLSSFSGGLSNAASGAISGSNRAIRLSSITVWGSLSLGGGITNAGTISAGNTAIDVNSLHSFYGGITNSGTISAHNASGILTYGITSFSGDISNSGVISAGGVGIGVRTSDISSGVSTFGGKVSNAGSITARTGILVGDVVTFANGVTNSGTISASAAGIQVGFTASSGKLVRGVTTFSGSLSNSGTISAKNGILVGGVTSFANGLTNSGTISASAVGIGMGFVITSPSGSQVTMGISTVSGNISNSGTISAKTGISVGTKVTFASGSAIVNSGTIIGSTAAIDASGSSSPVTIDQKSGLISGAIKLSSKADVLNISGGTVNGNIVGSGTQDTLNFALGSGSSLTYGSSYKFTGLNQVNVNSGAVILDGAGNSASNVSISSGASLAVGDASHTGASLTSTNPVDVYGTLLGHGTVSGGVNVKSGGTLSPGGSIGTLTINGNLVFSPTGFYAVEISPPASSQTLVNGTATLNAASVIVTIAPPAKLGAYLSHVYTILKDTAGTIGPGNMFNSKVTVSQAGLTPAEKLVFQGDVRLSDDSKDVYLLFPAYAIVLNLPSTGPLNAQNAAGGINRFILSGGTLPAGFQNLTSLSGAALNSAVNHLAGQAGASFPPTGFLAGDLFLNLMLDPFTAGRGTCDPFGPAWRYWPADLVRRAKAACPAHPPRYSAWAAGYGGGGTYQGNAFTGAATMSNGVYGFAAGFDDRLSPKTVVGFALGGGGTTYGLDQSFGSGHSGMAQAGAYGTTSFGPAYLSGALAYSWHDVSSTRILSLAGFDTLDGEFNANVLSSRLEAGYRVPLGLPIGVTPYVANEAQGMFLPGFSETPALGSSNQFALTYYGRDYWVDRAELGTWLDYDYALDKNVDLRLYSRFAYVRRFDNEGLAYASFQQLPGSNFAINTALPADNAALVTAGLDVKLSHGWSILAKFDGELAGTTDILSGNGELRKVW